MFPFASFPENLAAFCAVLRREHGFHVGPARLHDAARALSLTAIGDERAVRDTLRPILSSTSDHAAAFDRAFQAFFHPRTASQLEAWQRSPVEGPPGTGTPVGSRRGREPELESAGIPAAAARLSTTLETGDVRDEPGAALLRSSYSPVAGEGQPPDLEPVDREWRRAAALFVRRIETALSRRWKPARHGARFDLRRTLRSSLHTGGEPVTPRWRARPRLRPRFVVVLDGSRSMAGYTASACRMTVALASAADAVEAFVFSTALERVTPHVRRAAGGVHQSLPRLHHAWGGGTGIGVCLRDLVHRYGPRTLGRDSVVVIVSDGLDVGASDVLRQAMAELHRRSAALIWLNPLMALPGYEATALGMRTARGFVTTLARVEDAADLRRLAGLVRVRA